MSELTAPFLSEHESRDGSEATKPGYNPEPEEKKALDLVNRLYSRAKKYRKRYDSKWLDFYRMFRGRQWKEVRPAYRHSEVVNLIFQTIQSMVPILTDAQPKLEFLPTIPDSEDQADLADILSKVAENDWVHNNWLAILVEILLDGHLYGKGFGYVGFDEKARHGLGNILFESEDPFYQFPDPQTRYLNDRHGKFWIKAEPKDIAELKAKYPDKAQFISGDLMDFAQADKADIYQVMFKSPVDSKLIVEGPSANDTMTKNQTLLITLYFKDDEVEAVVDAETRNDPMGDPSKLSPQPADEVEKLKYPHGRKIEVAGGVMLCDGEADFEDGLFPFIDYSNYVLPREFWAMGEVEQLESPQKVVNKLMSFVLDTMTLMGNPIWVVDPGKTGIDTDNLINKPGLIVETDDVEGVRREPGVELPPYVMQMYGVYRQLFDGISGQTDVSRGVTPADGLSGEAINSLQQAQQTRAREKSRHIDRMLQDFGKLYISRVCQFYSIPRIYRVTGNDNVTKFFHFHVEKLDAHPQTQEAFVSDQGQPMQRKFAVVTDQKNETRYIEMESDFDVRVSTGSSLPFMKAQKADESMKLFQLGVIDDEELLKNMNYPNYEAVLKRVMEKKQQSMQMQMQMQQAQMQSEAGMKAQVDQSKEQAKTQGGIAQEVAKAKLQAMQPQPPPQGLA